MFTGIDVQSLVACLEQVPPVNLKGVELLRQLRAISGDWFPQVSADVLSEATAEMIEYTKASAAAVRKLQAVPPIPLRVLPVAEFCL
jgi:hypothetical protein